MIVIMRHGQAEGYASADHLRNLTPKGRMQAEATAEQLKSVGIERIVHSPYVRARQTAEEVNKTMSLPMTQSDDITPEGNAHLVASWLETQDNVLVVTHMPFVGELAMALTSGKQPVGFSTGVAAIYEKSTQGELKLAQVVEPNI